VGENRSKSCNETAAYMIFQKQIFDHENDVPQVISNNVSN